jgi:hypothetical protein
MSLSQRRPVRLFGLCELAVVTGASLLAGSSLPASTAAANVSGSPGVAPADESPAVGSSSGPPIYLDSSFTPRERAVDLVSRMTLQEKIRQAVTKRRTGHSSAGGVSVDRERNLGGTPAKFDVTYLSGDQVQLRSEANGQYVDAPNAGAGSSPDRKPADRCRVGDVPSDRELGWHVRLAGGGEQ